MKKNSITIIFVCLCLAAYSQQFTFQGKLYQNGVPVNGPQTFQFFINSPINWSETQNNVQVNNGLYAVVLGSINPLPLNLFDVNDNSRELVVRVNGNSIDTVTIFAPFERDYTVPQYVKNGGLWDSLKGKPSFIDTSIQLLALRGDTLGITQGNYVILPQVGGSNTTGNDSTGSLAVNGTLTVYDTAVNSILPTIAPTLSTPIDTVWQSFTAPSNGTLAGIKLYMSVSSPTYVFVNIYPGNNTSGQAILSGIVSGVSTVLEPQYLNISNILPSLVLTYGSVYTFQVIAPVGGMLTVDHNGNNPYPLGRSNFGPSDDLAFNLYTNHSSPSCINVNNQCYVGIGTDTPTSQLTVFGRVEDRTGFITPVGSIMAFAGRNVPKGWLLCDGKTYLRDQYVDLFAAIDSSWGSGDGINTFNVPDLRGRFVRGVDGTAGNDPNNSSRTAINQGGNVGNSVGSLQGDTIMSHNHTVPVVSSGSTCSFCQGTEYFQNNQNTGYYGTTPTTFNVPINYTGASETRPKNAYVNYIIKY